MRFFWRVIINAIALWLAAAVLDGVTLVSSGDSIADRILTALIIGLLLALVNGIVKPLIKFFAFPVYVVTLGLFSLVVNALMLLLTAWISRQAELGLYIDGFWWAVAGALFISVAGMILQAILPVRGRARR